MSKKQPDNKNQISETTMDDLDQAGEFNIDDDDFGILIDSEGNLKTIFGSDELLDNPPESVVKILEIFGISDTYSLSRIGATIH